MISIPSYDFESYLECSQVRGNYYAKLDLFQDYENRQLVHHWLTLFPSKAAITLLRLDWCITSGPRSRKLFKICAQFKNLTSLHLRPYISENLDKNTIANYITSIVLPYLLPPSIIRHIKDIEINLEFPGKLEHIVSMLLMPHLFQVFPNTRSLSLVNICKDTVLLRALEKCGLSKLSHLKNISTEYIMYSVECIPHVLYMSELPDLPIPLQLFVQDSRLLENITSLDTSISPIYSKVNNILLAKVSQTLKHLRISNLETYFIQSRREHEGNYVFPILPNLLDIQVTRSPFEVSNEYLKRKWYIGKPQFHLQFATSCPGWKLNYSMQFPTLKSITVERAPLDKDCFSERVMSDLQFFETGLAFLYDTFLAENCSSETVTYFRTTLPLHDQFRLLGTQKTCDCRLREFCTCWELGNKQHLYNRVVTTFPNLVNSFWF